MLLLLVCENNQTVARFSQSKFFFLTAPTGNNVQTIVERHTQGRRDEITTVKQENCDNA